MKNKHKKMKQLLAGPYMFWCAAFIIIPLLMILYYGFTDKDGGFTFLNIARITTPENLKALGLALLLSFVSTVFCLILAYPLSMILTNLGVNQQSFIVLIFILPMWMNFLLRTLAWQNLLEKTVSSMSSWSSCICRRWILSIRRMPSYLAWFIISCRSWYCPYITYCLR